MAYNLGTAEGRIIIDGSGASRGFAVATVAANAFFSAIQSKLDSVERLGENLIKLGTVGAVGLGGAVKAAANFEQGLSNIRAVSGATEKQMEGIRTTALRLGKDTAFSASEAAFAMEALIKAGVSTEDVMSGAADATVNLAAAGGVDLVTAAEIAANALNQFNLDGKDMANVADLIAGAANASAIDVGDFGFSLSQAGAVANLTGLKFEDLAVAIAEMGQAGIKGSDAGTSIKTFLTNLIPTMDKQKALFEELGLLTINEGKAMQFLAEKGIKPATKDFDGINGALEKYVERQGGAAVGTAANAKAAQELAQKAGLMQNAFFDANGELKSFGEVQEILKNATKDMTREQKLATLETLFGSDAIRAAAVFAEEGAAGYNEMATAMGKVGAAETAATRLDNLNGSIEQLKGSFETMMITIGEVFLPLVRKFVDAITAFINIFNNLPAPVQKAIAVILGLGTAASLLTGILIKLLFILTPLLAKFLGLTALRQIFSIFTVGFKALRGGQGALVAVSLAASRAGVVFTRFQKIGKVLFAFLTRFPKVLMALRAAWVFAFGPWGIAIAAVVAAVVLLYKKFEPFRELVDRIGRAIRDNFLSAINALKEAWDAFVYTFTSGFTEDEGTGIEKMALAARDAWEALKSLVQLFKTEVLPVLQEAGRILVQELGKAWKDIVAVFQTSVLPAARDLATTFNQDILPALKDLWTVLQPVIVTMAKVGIAIQVGLLIALFKVAQFIIKYVLPATIKLNTYFLQYVIKAIVLVVKWIAFVNTAWITMSKILIDVVIGAIKFFINMWTTLWNAAVLVVRTTINLIVGLFQWFTRTLQSLWNAFWNGPIGQVVKATMELIKLTIQLVLTAILVVVTQLLDRLYKGFMVVFNLIKSVVTSVFNFLKPYITTTANAIKNVLNGVWNTIRSITSTVWRQIQNYIITPFVAAYNRVKSVVGSILNAIRGAWSSANSQTSGAWRGLYNTIRGWIDNVMGIVRGLKNRVIGALSGAGSWLWSAGRRIIQGLLDGINSMIGSVRGALNNLTGLIPDWKGPADKDAKLLTPAGEKIMKSLILGFAKQMPEIKKYLGGVTMSIPAEVGAGGSAAVARRMIPDQTPAWAREAITNIYNTWNVYNPVAEKTSTTTTREATRRANIGLVS